MKYGFNDGGRTHGCGEAHYDVIVLIPVYQDWTAASMVCREIDATLADHPELSVRVLLVDDGSPDGTLGWQPFECNNLNDISVLFLRTNLGHQRAICVALCHIHDALFSDFVVVMDADGEDRSHNAWQLIELAIQRGSPVLFAERRKRLVGLTFRIGYAIFRVVHRILTGVSVRVGNFSVISFPVLSRLVAMPELWNHYPGAVFKSRVHFDSIPMDRGDRVHGHSKMNLVSLVTHGLAGIASFHETVATRILIANAIGLVLLLAGVGVAVAIRLFTDIAIPGWATYTTALIVILVIQLLALSFSLVFSLVSDRSKMTFLPVRDFRIFIQKVVKLSHPFVPSNSVAAAVGGDR